MTATEPGEPGADEDLARHVAGLTREDRRHDRRLLWWELLAVLIIAALLTARALWLT
ncbi:hypothetical protein SNE510_09910 [Streptomyces sp. NE5-10]|uniref:hypothetical protein n=1 Tax=Streptomyces sp. NE5-10 TaxID=2759674 RepID=UPI00190494A5|nr:hypothetical protein [Streptomyces sp. NE5-10]GHJ91472.1 hypothetical protein SNE510_09910 [Streptomyces sp. NE5-10]